MAVWTEQAAGLGSRRGQKDLTSVAGGADTAAVVAVAEAKERQNKV